VNTSFKWYCWRKEFKRSNVKSKACRDLKIEILYLSFYSNSCVNVATVGSLAIRQHNASSGEIEKYREVFMQPYFEITAKSLVIQKANCFNFSEEMETIHLIEVVLDNRLCNLQVIWFFPWYHKVPISGTIPGFYILDLRATTPTVFKTKNAFVSVCFITSLRLRTEGNVACKAGIKLGVDELHKALGYCGEGILKTTAGAND
jgi:hypothetical protein